MTHICVGKLISIGSDNGLSPVRRQAIIRTNAGILLIGPLGTNFSETLIEIQTFSLRKIRLQMSSAKCRPFCPGLNVLNQQWASTCTCVPWSQCVNPLRPGCIIWRQISWANFDSGDDLSPARCNTITWTNANLLYQWNFGRNSNYFYWRTCISNCLQTGGHLTVLPSIC